MPAVSISNTATTVTMGPCDTFRVKNRTGSSADLTIAYSGLISSTDILEAGDTGYYRYGDDNAKIVVFSSIGSCTFIWSEAVRGA